MMTFQESVRLINESLPLNSNVFIDAGNTGACALNHLQLNGENICYVSLAMGGMGNSLGVALGAAFASEKKSFVFLGDGAFLMYGLEIHTALEHQLPITVIIFNNNSHGMCTTREEIFVGSVTGLNDFQPSYFATGLKSMFPLLKSYEVFNASDLKEALLKQQQLMEPFLISINLTQEELPPFQSFKK